MRLPKDYAAPKQEETAVEYIWEQKGCVQQRREPIVRCRDCAYINHREYNNGLEYQTCSYFDSEYAEVEPDGFCAWGERKASA